LRTTDNRRGRAARTDDRTWADKYTHDIETYPKSRTMPWKAAWRLRLIKFWEYYYHAQCNGNKAEACRELFRRYCRRYVIVSADDFDSKLFNKPRGVGGYMSRGLNKFNGVCVWYELTPGTGRGYVAEYPKHFFKKHELRDRVTAMKRVVEIEFTKKKRRQ